MVVWRLSARGRLAFRAARSRRFTHRQRSRRSRARPAHSTAQSHLQSATARRPKPRMVVEEMACRLCFGEEEDDGPLVQPCACRGSAKWIHKHCLKKWRRTSPKEDAAYRCGQCRDHYCDSLSLELLLARLQAERTNRKDTTSTLDTLATELTLQGKAIVPRGARGRRRGVRRVLPCSLSLSTRQGSPIGSGLLPLMSYTQGLVSLDC